MNYLDYRCRVRDIQPGDVLRNEKTNMPMIVKEVRGYADDPDRCDVIYEPGDRGTRTHWDAVLGGQVEAAGPEAHYPLCSRCGELWPCLHTQAVNEMAVAMALARRACEHCGKPVTGMRVNVTIEDRGLRRDVLFHGRKGPCLNAARRINPNARVS